MTDNNELKGLGGWLILVGIGVVISPIRLLITYIPIYKPIFEEGTWAMLTTVGSEYYVPYFGSLLIGEMVFNLTMLLVCIYLVYLFFSKHYLFPKVYIGIIIASLIFIPLDSWMVSIIIPGVPIFDSETAVNFIRIFIVGIIWVPYMLVSKRVRATFVEKAPDKNLQLTAGNLG